MKMKNRLTEYVKTVEQQQFSEALPVSVTAFRRVNFNFRKKTVDIPIMICMNTHGVSLSQG